MKPDEKSSIMSTLSQYDQYTQEETARSSNILRRISARLKRKSKIGREESERSIMSETVDLTNYEIDEFEESRPDLCQNRCDRQSRAFVEKVVDSTFFNMLMVITITLNILFLVMEVVLPDETDTSSDSGATTTAIEQFLFNNFGKDMTDIRIIFKRLDPIFLSVYLLEFMLKFYVNPIGYWKQWTNRLDFLILVLSFAQVIFVKSGSSGGETGNNEESGTTVSSMRILRTSTNVKIVKTLRAFRALRTLKTLTLVRGAQVIFVAIIRSQRKALKDVILILICFIFLMSLLTYSLFYDSQPPPRADQICETWGCFQATFVSLFMIVTCDGWFEIQEVLDVQFSKDYPYYILARVLMMFIIIMGHFVIFNIFIAVNIMQVQEANQDYNEEIVAEREAILQRKKDKILQRQYDDVKKLREEQEARGCSFHQMIENFKNTLKHEDYTLTEDIITDIEWMENFLFSLDMLDNTTYKLQQLSFEYTNCLIYSQNEELARRIGT
jgi:cation channel sperm-associated protein 3